METIKSPGIIFYLSYFYAYYIPIILYVIWLPISIYDLGKREDISKSLSIIWTGFIIIVPWFGSLVYLLMGKSGIPFHFRLAITLPGIILAILFAIFSTLTST